MLLVPPVLAVMASCRSVCVCVCGRAFANMRDSWAGSYATSSDKPMIHLGLLLMLPTLDAWNIGQLHSSFQKPRSCAEPQESSFLEILSRRGIELQNPWVNRHAETGCSSDEHRPN